MVFCPLSILTQVFVSYFCFLTSESWTFSCWRKNHINYCYRGTKLNFKIQCHASCLFKLNFPLKRVTLYYFNMYCIAKDMCARYICWTSLQLSTHNVIYGRESIYTTCLYAWWSISSTHSTLTVSNKLNMFDNSCEIGVINMTWLL